MTLVFRNRALTRLIVLMALLVAVQGMAAAQDAGSLQFVTWTESSNAFAFDIPYGWTVEAYTVDVFGMSAPYVYVFEPEERAVVIAGSPSSVAYLDIDASQGYAEGDTVPVEGYTFVAGAYQTPAVYLEHYLRQDVLANACDSVFIVQIADAEPTDAESAASEISLECHFDGGMANGYFYLQTMSTPIEGVGQMWMPTDFYGYLAEPAFVAQAEQALAQMAQSFTINETAAQPQTATVDTPADAPVNQTTDSGYDPDAFLQAQQELYQQQQTAAMISNMMQMQHEASMAIINNIGSSSTTYEYQWVWTP